MTTLEHEPIIFGHFVRTNLVLDSLYPGTSDINKPHTYGSNVESNPGANDINKF